jgi:LEA14-like dessication related protein
MPLALAATACVLCARCDALEQALHLRRPGVEVRGASLREVTAQSATLVFETRVTNPYSVDLPLANFDYALASNGLSLLNGDANVAGTVPAGGAKTLQLPVTVTYKQLLAVLKDIRPGEVIPYDASLGLSARAPGGTTVRVPFSREGRLPVPATPGVEVRGIDWGKLSASEAHGTLNLAVTNRNDFPFDLSKIDYSLWLGDYQIAHTSIDTALDFPAGQSKDLEIPLSLSPRSLGLAAWRLLTGSEASYRLQGSLKLTTEFGPIDMPVDKRGQMTLRQ